MEKNKQSAPDRTRIIAAVAYAISERKVEYSSGAKDMYEVIVELADDFIEQNPGKEWTGRELSEAAGEYAMKLHPDSADVIITDESEIIDVLLDPNHTPAAYNRKIQELMNDCGITEEEAQTQLLTPIPLELIYHSGQGLFAVESEAVDATEIYSPYNGREVPKIEE